MYNAAVLTAPGKIHIEQKPGRQPGAGEVLLRIQYAGICGTDLSLYRGDYPVPLPLVPGHEFSTRVMDCGAGVDAAWLGKRVACEINNSCVAYGKRDLCAACTHGLPTHCLRRTVTGIISHPGAFAEYLLAPAGNLHELPDAISDEAAVFVEPLAAAIRTFELSPVTQGDLVVVLGCGRLGRLITLVANRLGARVLAVARSEQSLRFVRQHAWKCVRVGGNNETAADPAVVEHSVSGEAALRDLVLQFSDGLGADMVIEATGRNSNIALAMQLVRPLGVVSLKSTSGVPAEQLRTTEAIVNEVQVHTSRCGPFDKAIQFMQQHKLPGADWISQSYPLHDVVQALAAAERLPKVILRLNEN
jgi:alcohol dehydrogenase